MIGTILIGTAFPLFSPSVFSLTNVDDCTQYVESNISHTNTENINHLECRSNGDILVTAYYSAFSVLWGIGWAAVKITHMSLLPVLAPSEEGKMTLNTINYAVNIMSTAFLYGASWLFMRTGDNKF